MSEGLGNSEKITQTRSGLEERLARLVAQSREFSTGHLAGSIRRAETALGHFEAQIAVYGKNK